MKKMIAGLLFLAIFLAASVGGIIANLSHASFITQNKPENSLMLSEGQSGSQKPFARLCGDEGGPGKPFGAEDHKNFSI
jgi:hypothetical protein